MTVVGQWKAVFAALPDNWIQVALRLELPDRASTERASAVLAPAGPHRAEPTVLRFNAARDGSSIGPENLRRLLERVPAGRLVLERVETRQPTPSRIQELPKLAAAWDTELAKLPADWSDVWAELELTSTDFVERAAVLCIQMNPRRDGRRAALRFRSARRSGYGVSPAMTRRCLERCDAEGITGAVTVLRALSDTHHVSTQGPVLLLDGQTL